MPPVVADTIVPYGTAVPLVAQSSDSMAWYSSPFTSQPIAKGSIFTTAPLFSDTSFWIDASNRLREGEKSIFTGYTSVNPANGNMFDIKPVSDIVLDSFWLNLASGNHIMELYYRPGGYQGSMASGAGWISAGSVMVTSQGQGLGTPVVFGGLPLDSGKLYGIYLTSVNGTMYSIATIQGSAQSYTDLTFYWGHTIQFPFGTAQSGRKLSGMIWYSKFTRNCSGTRVPVQITVLPQNQHDATVKKIIYPVNIVKAGAPSTPQVVIANNGFDTISPNELSVSFQLGQKIPETVIYPLALLPGAADTLAMPAFVVQAGFSEMVFKSHLSGDAVPANDTMAIRIFGELAPSIPYFDDFEQGQAWYNPALPEIWHYGTPSGIIIQNAYSGTQAWYASLSGSTANPIVADLYSPPFNSSWIGFSDTMSLGFHHWMAMAPGDYGQIQYSTNGGNTWHLLGTINDSLGTNWYNTIYSSHPCFADTNSGWVFSSFKLNPHTFNLKPDIRFRFRFFSESLGVSDGWAIDNFTLTFPQSGIDLSVADILAPRNDTALGSIVNTRVLLRNFGNTIINSVPVSLFLDSIPVASETWTGILSPGDTAHFTFTTPFISPKSIYNLCVEAQVPGDVNTYNNHKCRYYGTEPAYHDVGILKILYPVTDSTGNLCYFHSQTQPWYSYNIVVRIKNYGQTEQTQVPVNYSYNTGGTVYTDNLFTLLNSQNTYDFTLSTPFLPDQGLQQVCIITALPQDKDTSNNSFCRVYNGTLCTGITTSGPASLRLGQNVPNPASSITRIPFSISSGGNVTISMTNLYGQTWKICSSEMDPGDHFIDIDVSAFAPGMYFYRLEFNGEILSRKLVVAN